MAASRWDPFSDLLNIRQAMDRLVEEGVGRVRGAAAAVPLDMWETDGEVMVRASVPGVPPENLEVNVHGDVLTIRGDVPGGPEVKEGDYVHRELRAGRVQRSVTLPANVNADAAEATLDHGILALRLPKVEAARPRSIQVKAGEPRQT